MKIQTKVYTILAGMLILIALIGALSISRGQEAAAVAILESADDARTLSVAVAAILETESSPSLQAFVQRLHTNAGRDIVIVNSEQVILADVVPSNIGAIFDHDLKDEVGFTLRDGQTRPFIETSIDYPDGINLLTTPLLGRDGQTIGAIILEYTPLYRELQKGEARNLRDLGIGIGLALAIAAVSAVFAAYSVCRPLQGLTAAAKGFAAGRTDLPLPPPGKDEIGELAAAFRHMMEQRQHAEDSLRAMSDELEKRVARRTAELADSNISLQSEIAARARTHQQLLDASRLAGKAEVASGILHNVGNVLNSINVSTSVLKDAVRKTSISTLDRVVGLLEANKSDLANFFTNNPQGTKMPDFLRQLHTQLKAQQDAVALELQSLNKNVEHVNVVISSQQQHAKVSGVRQTIDAVSFIEDSVRVAHIPDDVFLERDFAEVGDVSVEHHSVIQILVNLIRNAAWACKKGGPGEKKVSLHLRNGQGSIKIAVRDNGIGIPPENISKIFQHGFTTREDGHGFGLHSAAIAAHQMGGALHVQSDGAGRGATFTLELPVMTSESSQEPE